MRDDGWMLRPDRGELAAYVPLGDEVEPEDELDFQDRESVIAFALQQRLAEGGLPVDRATLEQVADTVMDPGYRLPGLFYTAAEADDEVPDEVVDAVREYLAGQPGLSGGTRMGWSDGRRTLFVRVVRDLDRHRSALADIAPGQVVVEPAAHSEEELGEIEDRISDDMDELRDAGIEFFEWGSDPNEGVVSLGVIAADKDAALKTLHDRYGPLVVIESWAPAWYEVCPRAFGSWSTEGNDLEVFYAIDFNGEEPAGCTAIEDDDTVTVSVTISDPTGIKTLAGGWQIQVGRITLSAPLGHRRVIDASCAKERPSLSEL